MAARKKVTELKFKNRAVVVYDNDCITGVEYENKNEDQSEEYQENEYYTDRNNIKMKIKKKIQRLTRRTL